MKKLTKTPAEIAIDYENAKKLKTIRGWNKKYQFDIDLANFNHFKENKKVYLELRKYEQLKKTLNTTILEQIY